MQSLIEFLKHILISHRDSDEQYLSQALDVEDLEHRLRTLDARESGFSIDAIRR